MGDASTSRPRAPPRGRLVSHARACPRKASGALTSHTEFEKRKKVTRVLRVLQVCNANACVDLTSSSNNATASKPNWLHTSSLPLREQIHNSHKNFCSQKKVLIHINFGQRVRYLILCPIKTKHKIIIARGEARAESRGAMSMVLLLALQFMK